MKRINQALSLLMLLLFCVASINSSMISNAEETSPDAVTLDNAVGEDITDDAVPDGGITDDVNVQGDTKATEEENFSEVKETQESKEEDGIVADSETTETPESTTDSKVATEETADLTESAAQEEGTDEAADETAIEELTEVTKAEAAETITVTFKVVNGSWDDGTTEDKQVTIVKEDGNDPMLPEDVIPVVGTKPCDNTYKSGSWDVSPTVDTTITEDTTYTYTYEKKKAAVVIKAPEARTLYYIEEAQ